MWPSLLLVLLAATALGVEQKLCPIRRERCVKKSECRPLAHQKLSNNPKIDICGKDTTSVDSSFRVCCWDPCWDDDVPGANYMRQYRRRRNNCGNQTLSVAKFRRRSNYQGETSVSNTKSNIQGNKGPWSSKRLNSACNTDGGLLANRPKLLELLPKDCGVARMIDILPHLKEDRGSSHGRVKRVTQGENSKVMAQPWMAMLMYQHYKIENTAKGTKSNVFMSYDCGGTLISSEFVMTAAHCVDTRKEHCDSTDCFELMSVSLGERDVRKRDGKDCAREAASQLCPPKPEDFNIKSVHIHENYTSKFLVNDIALIRLDKPVKFSPLKNSVSPVCLPVRKLACEDLSKDKQLIVAGWGSYLRVNTKVVDKASEVLQSTALRFEDMKKCQSQYNKTFSKCAKTVSEFTLCAKGNAKQDACNGDSGGPLLIKSIDGRVVQVGIVSFGSAECDSSLPGVYTKVASYMEWILNTIKNVS